MVPSVNEVSDSNGSDVKSIVKTFDILETVMENEGLGISEIADHCGLANSTVHRHLNTLERRGYIVKEGGKYEIAIRFLKLGEYAKARRKVYQLVEPAIEEVAEQTSELVQFVSYENKHALYVESVAGDHAVRADPEIGECVPLHATAAGKAILAYLPDDEVKELIALRGLPQLTENTITDEEELFEELELVREREYSTNDEEQIEGLRAVGVPIRKTANGGRAIGALSIAGPIRRLGDKRFHEEFPELLQGIANEIELNITYS